MSIFILDYFMYTHQCCKRMKQNIDAQWMQWNKHALFPKCVNLQFQVENWQSNNFLIIPCERQLVHASDIHYIQIHHWVCGPFKRMYKSSLYIYCVYTPNKLFKFYFSIMYSVAFYYASLPHQFIIMYREKNKNARTHAKMMPTPKRSEKGYERKKSRIVLPNSIYKSFTYIVNDNMYMPVRGPKVLNFVKWYGLLFHL